MQKFVHFADNASQNIRGLDFDDMIIGVEHTEKPLWICIEVNVISYFIPNRFEDS